MEKSAFSDYWPPMNGLVCQLAARLPQVALPRRSPMDWECLMIGLVGQLAARQLPSLGVYQWIGHLMAVKWPLGSLETQAYNKY